MNTANRRKLIPNNKAQRKIFIPWLREESLLSSNTAKRRKMLIQKSAANREILANTVHDNEAGENPTRGQSIDLNTFSQSNVLATSCIA